MGIGNVSERRLAQPSIGISVVILALGPHGDSAANGSSRLWLPLVRRVRQPFMGSWALPGGDLRVGHSLEESAFKALESTTELHPKYLEQLYTFGDPSRSSGGLPMVSIVYWALVGEAETKDFAERTTSNGSRSTICRISPSTIDASSTTPCGARAANSNTPTSPPNSSARNLPSASCTTYTRLSPASRSTWRTSAEKCSHPDIWKILAGNSTWGAAAQRPYTGTGMTASHAPNSRFPQRWNTANRKPLPTTRYPRSCRRDRARRATSEIFRHRHITAPCRHHREHTI